MKAEGKQVEVNLRDAWVAKFQVAGRLVVVGAVACDLVVGSLVQ